MGASNKSTEGRFGIQGMRERAKRIGGSLLVDAVPTGGVRITVTSSATSVARLS